ncbi:MAG: helix-hairpin-helix domain-containing protein [Chitinophagaceae bacterium]
MLKEYLSFTKKERIAIVTLVALILGIYLMPRFIKPKEEPPSEKEIREFKLLEQQLASNDSSKKNNYTDDDEPPLSYASHTSEENRRPVQLFYFDPNTISANDWKRLGLRDKTIGTIQKYLSKGGHFYKPADIKKIYGLKPDEYERIAAYIRIERPEAHEPSERKSYNAPDRHAESPKKFAARISIIDINTADTAGFVALPGIGSKLAARIVNFREKLGGFYSVEQVGETYGLPDSTFQKIRSWLSVQEGNIRQININTVTADELKLHPYIRWNLAGAIIRYREQHGTFKTLEELKQIVAINSETYAKIAPYLRISN